MGMNRAGIMAVLLLLAEIPKVLAAGDELAQLMGDRAAIERVYHEHRTGAKLSFEEAMPAAVLEKLVSDDLRKEAVLARVYGVKVTGEMIEKEVGRMDTTTRAPEMLGEIKRALGNDPDRFARAMARPIVVERLLREKYENDDALHAPVRRMAEEVRERLKAGQKVEGGEEVTWELTARPAGEVTDERPAAATAPVKSTAKSGSYSVEATAQIAELLSGPGQDGQGKAEKRYMEDVDPRMQKILRSQLRQPGDVSAVIETPAGFLLFEAKVKTELILAVRSLTFPKRSCGEWLAMQPEAVKKP